MVGVQVCFPTMTKGPGLNSYRKGQREKSGKGCAHQRLWKKRGPDISMHLDSETMHSTEWGAGYSPHSHMEDSWVGNVGCRINPTLTFCSFGAHVCIEELVGVWPCSRPVDYMEENRQSSGTWNLLLLCDDQETLSAAHSSCSFKNYQKTKTESKKEAELENDVWSQELCWSPCLAVF